MPTFAGYEPNNLVGKGPGHVPISMGASGTAQTQQLVPAETLDADLSNLFDAEMSSLLEDMFEEPMVPIAESGTKVLARSSGALLDEPAVSANCKRAKG